MSEIGSGMTHEEYRDALDDLGYTQEEAASLLGVSPRTSRKWALDETRIPGSVAILLRLMRSRPELKPVIEDLGHLPTRERSAG